MLYGQSLSQHDYQRILIEIKLHEELFALIQAENKAKIYAPIAWTWPSLLWIDPSAIFFPRSKLTIGVLAGIFFALTPPALRLL